MAHDVFVCYSSEDKTIANAACAKLESAGIRCWMAPRDPIAGIPYGRQLVDAITAARIVLLIFSGNANRSEHVLRELEVASDSSKIIVPFRIENVVPSGDLRYYITRVHWLDAMSPPMESRFNELVALMQRLMDLPITPVPPVPSSARTRRVYPALAALVIIAGALAIALSLYVMKRSAAPPVHTAKSTPQPKRSVHPVAKRLATVSTPIPPTPQIVYVPQPQGTPVRVTIVPNVPKSTAAPKPHASPKGATPPPRPTPTPPSTPAPRQPISVQYRLPRGSIFFIRHLDGTSWHVARAAYEPVGRATVDGTTGTTLLAPSGREWLFVPDIGASGLYAHQICFSLAGPGLCDAHKIFPIISER